jgi:hypothetical protein
MPCSMYRQMSRSYNQALFRFYTKLNFWSPTYFDTSLSYSMFSVRLYNAFLIVVLGIFVFSVQDNQQMLKGVVSFYYTHQITPTCFGSSLPSSGVYTFLVSYSNIIWASGACGLCLAAAAGHTERIAGLFRG